MTHFFWFLLALLPILSQAQDAPQSLPPPYDSAHFSWRKPVPRHRLRELQPDRPGVTENPFTVDAGHVQLEVDVLRLRNSAAGADERRRTWQVGYSIIKLGLSRRTAVHLELPLYNVQKALPALPSEGPPRRAGFGDVVLRLKHNFLGDLQDGSLGMAVIGYVRLPSGGAVGEGAAEYGLVLPIDIELSDQANLEAQLETDLNYDRDHARRYVRLVPSVALEYDFAKKLGLVVETVTQWDTEQRRWLASFNIAPIFMLTKNLQLDLGTHRALTRRSENEYFVGFTLRR
ncbi:transporter [uncultured Hymenobacter sp.]|uniref:transporter n=1 Tax=uncultured Hymenobacter sp. TaxID=170016 RepID=UPI0035CA9D46